LIIPNHDGSCATLDFTTRYLKIGVTNNQSFAYFVCVKRYGCCKPRWVLDA